MATPPPKKKYVVYNRFPNQSWLAACISTYNMPYLFIDVFRSLPRFGQKRQARKEPAPASASQSTNEETESFFSHPQLTPSTSVSAQTLTSADLIAMIRARNPHPVRAAAIPAARPPGEDDEDEDNEGPPAPVNDENIELLRDIREFIAFRAMIDGQATTEELIAEFGSKLPPQKSPLFKKMLEQLCTHRQVEEKRLWRLKPEFR